MYVGPFETPSLAELRDRFYEIRAYDGVMPLIDNICDGVHHVYQCLHGERCAMHMNMAGLEHAHRSVPDVGPVLPVVMEKELVQAA